MKEKAITLKLTPLSPIHIGGHEQQLGGGADFIFHNNRCYVIDEHKLIQVLEKGKLIERFISVVEGTSRLNLAQFLNISSLSKNECNQLLSSISAYSCRSPSTNRIRPFIRNAYAQPYIPGTALKGALRTATLYCFVKSMSPAQKSEIVSRIDENLNRGKSREERRKELGDFLDEYFQKFELYYEGKKINETTPQETDLFRAIEISDSEPLDKNSLSIKEVRMVSLTSKNNWKFSRRRKKGGETQNPIRVYPECLLQRPIELKVKFDTVLLSRLQKPKDVDMSLKDFVWKRAKTLCPSEFHDEQISEVALAKTLISLSREFAENILEEEKEFFDPLGASTEGNLEKVKVFYKDLSPNLRLGWGSGMLGASIFYLLRQEGASDIIKKIARLFPQYQRRREPYGTLPDGDPIFELFPKTRRVIIEGRNAVSPLGWAKLEIL